ncbi:putative major sperm protein (MSP) [Plasmopara halstedii]
MITASVGVDSSLLLEPSRELLFLLPHSTSLQRPQSSLKLTNLSPVHNVVFRVRTRDPDAFTVRPTHGLLTPGASCQVIMTATSLTCERLSTMNLCDVLNGESSELFLVQSLELGDKVRHLEHLATTTTSLRALWKQVPKDCITESKMVYHFVNSGSNIVQDKSMFTRSLFSAKTSSQDHFLSQRNSLKTSAKSNHNEACSLNQSYSNFTKPSKDERCARRPRQQSIDSDASFHTTIEFPMSMSTRTSASKNTVTSIDSFTKVRRSEAEVSSLFSKNSKTRLCTEDNESVSDTMLTALSTERAPCDTTQQLSPLHYYIQPSDVLSFDVKPAPRYWGNTSFFVVNASQDNYLIFKVRTSNQSGYVVKPSRGVVSTTSAQEVIVSVCAPRGDAIFDPAEREAKDGFMIEVANISREKYNELTKTKEQKPDKLSSLWSLLPRDSRHSKKLSVKFKVTNNYGSSSANNLSKDAQFFISRESRVSDTKKDKRQSLHSAVDCMAKLSISSSTDESHDSDDKTTEKDKSQDSNRSLSTCVNTVDAEVDDNGSNTAEISARRGSAVVVISADRMDTVDFSNPQLSFFM